MKTNGKKYNDLSNYILNACISAVDRSVALLVLISTSPILGAVYIAHRLTVKDGGGFLYRGERVGKNGKRFMMFKVRTLVVNAEKKLTGCLYNSTHDLELPIGPFLRETRIDEIPQMFNVLKGEMALVGPRPERPSVCEALCNDIPGYNRRFAVLPGVTGLSQFLTPHGTSKRIRAKIDLLLARKMQSPSWRMLLVAWTGLAIARKLALKIWRLPVKLRNTDQNLDLKNIEVNIYRPLQETVEAIRLVPLEIGNNRMQVVSEHPLEDHENMDIILRRCTGKRRRISRCVTLSVDSTENRDAASGQNSDYSYTIEYRPASSVSAYFLERYILKQIVA